MLINELKNDISLVYLKDNSFLLSMNCLISNYEYLYMTKYE